MTPSTEQTVVRANAPEPHLEPDPPPERVLAIWTAGDFGRIATGYERGAAEFIARLALEPGEPVLDVACSTGNLSLPAARTGAMVTRIDSRPT